VTDSVRADVARRLAAFADDLNAAGFRVDVAWRPTSNRTRVDVLVTVTAPDLEPGPPAHWLTLPGLAD
jgi:hypothetical protein